MSRSLSKQLEHAVQQCLDTDVTIRRDNEAPPRTRLDLGTEAVYLEAATLSIDIRQYSSMTHALSRQVVVRILRAFFDGAVRLAIDNAGTVADFNGDGMIVIFTGEARVESAVRAAGQIKWFIEEVLKPRFEPILESDQLTPERFESFDAGFGIDEGPVLACRVGVGTVSEMSWIGNCVNAASKLCKVAQFPQSILITREAYDRISRHDEELPMKWAPHNTMAIGRMPRITLATMDCLYV